MSRLVDIPSINVQVDGAPLDTEAARALSAVRVHQSLSVPTQCELTFSNPTGPLKDGKALLPGTRLRLTVDGSYEPLFSGEVTAVELAYGPTTEQVIRVRGYDPLHRMRKRQTVRSHVDVTAADLARKLCSDLNLDVQAKEPGPRWPTLMQWRQADLDFLVDVAAQAGLYLTVQDSTLRLLSLAGEGEGIELVMGDNLVEAAVDVNTDTLCRRVESLAWDPWSAEPRRGKAETPRSGRRIGIQLDPARVGSPASRTIAGQALQSDELATSAAQAELDRRVAGETVLRGVASGDPRLRPGTPVEVSGIASAVCGQYLLTEVTHTIEASQGFLSMLSSAPPPPRPSRLGALTTVGRVTDVTDPSGQGRVRVTLSSFGDLESDWLQVLIPGAGPGKGLIAPPAPGDRVLVLLPGQDPAQGVVLGGLYGPESPPDDGVENGEIRRYTLVTPGGQRIQLNDAKDSVRIETQDGVYLQLKPGHARLSNDRGNYVDLSRGGLRIHASTDLDIAAPGKSVTIRAAAIDFSEA